MKKTVRHRIIFYDKQKKAYNDIKGIVRVEIRFKHNNR